ncbi:alpha-galactosidase/alpha-n-acetylgalactosaminidase, putative [Perkinsus marinus ATCC 50983]|uniref:Alpha-galactosidase n=1 Tax=Perkinsus marinus (strain ATCC 50983 / TXsc) TaxID=423536 RepID=C5LNC6_PERM5|nr:alpha-galactosidase/alpha-n-acetylgalactosaminidase, putative [Perkinsus marinus ATCC 50983]EER01766.1 alpha-galactosidase/alpha-n-acetylgalactosaminidase, putative [Perkinsus marinus ATCC 50983]|eukprot:XP_002769048.1 alpha-galactosidase/alpha-n-acetylgalactosaminidase, putative [Perkinsus marinus ATCC 50983]
MTHRVVTLKRRQKPPLLWPIARGITSDVDLVSDTVISVDELQEFQLCCASNLTVRSLVNDKYRNVGTVTFRFVNVTPLPAALRSAFSPRTEPRQGSTLRARTATGKNVHEMTIIGHRGIGSDEMGSRIRENTLLAFKQAAKYGADAVEFDVFLTADRTPMIFHDLEINHSNSSKKIPITSLCEEGLCSLDEDNQERIFTGRERVESSVSGGGSGSSNGSFCSGSSTPTSSSGKGGLLEAGKRVRSLHDLAATFPSRGRVESEVSPLEAEGVRDSAAVQEKLPSLKAVLEGTPDDLGALIEIKYPTAAAIRKYPSRSCHDRGTVADVILRYIYDYGCPATRRYMFSSFDPEMCLALRQKQARFPIILNTWFGYEDVHDNTEVDFTDLRNRDPLAAAEFCSRNGIEGLCLEASWLHEHYQFADYCRRAGLTLYTYGAENNKTSRVEMQMRHMGVAGCIVDNIGRFRGGADGEGAVTGGILPDPERFPHGVKWLADYMHSRGLKLGIYADIGTKTCGGYPGLEGHFEQDVKTFAEWGIDSLKVDGCYADTSTFEETYPQLGRLLNATGRPILYSCSWPAYLADHAEDKDVLVKEIAPACNLWRNFDDIYDSWASIQGITNFWARQNSTDILIRAAGPGHWNDPDMIVVGNNGLSEVEQQSQFALWAMFAAPLYLAADLRTMPSWAREIVQNKEIIAVNQDPLGKQGYIVWSENGARIWIRELAGTDKSVDTWAVLLENSNSIFGLQRIALQPTRHIPGWAEGTQFSVRDLFRGRNIGLFVDEYSANVDTSSVHFVIIRKVRKLKHVSHLRIPNSEEVIVM